MRTPLAAALAALALAAPAAAHHLTWVESLLAGAAGDQVDFSRLRRQLGLG